MGHSCIWGGGGGGGGHNPPQKKSLAVTIHDIWDSVGHLPVGFIWLTHQLISTNLGSLNLVPPDHTHQNEVSRLTFPYLNMHMEHYYMHEKWLTFQLGPTLLGSWRTFYKVSSKSAWSSRRSSPAGIQTLVNFYWD